MGRRIVRTATCLALVLFMASSVLCETLSPPKGPDILPWFYLPLTGQVALQDVAIEGAGVSGVNGVTMRIVGPVVFERVDVHFTASATWQDSEGRSYSTQSDPLTLSLWSVTARLSIYRDGQYWGTVELRQ